jgi:hypothetical protein
MASKLAAARLASSEGTVVLIAGGAESRVIERAMAGEDVGTLVTVAARRPARIRHIAVGARQRGALVVNDGALRALQDEKASLLPIGVVGVEGSFEKGDVVEVRDGSGRVHGRGVVNYPARPAASCRPPQRRHRRRARLARLRCLITRDNLGWEPSDDRTHRTTGDAGDGHGGEGRRRQARPARRRGALDLLRASPARCASWRPCRGRPPTPPISSAPSRRASPRRWSSAWALTPALDGVPRRPRPARRDARSGGRVTLARAR